jgi:hypothetical protein
MKYNILLLILAIIVLLYIATKFYKQNDTIFLCTTYFDCPKRDSWQMFQTGINKLRALHDQQTLNRIDKWIVVNEYSIKPRANWAKLMNQQYPFITFLQKSQQDQGQPKSLNILFPYMNSYKYWFHWEESWYPIRPFLKDAFDIMDNTKITQLQLTSNEQDKIDWIKRTTEEKTCTVNYCVIHHSREIDDNLGEDKIKTFDQLVRYWPLYSLQPSLNRVSFYDFGNFSTRKFPFPLVSEYDFAQRWYQRGGIKAVFKEGPLKKPDNYVSTHD